MNTVQLLGNLVKDPDLKYASGKDMGISRFTIAVGRRKKGETDFINCVAFGKTAEVIAQYFLKGNKIAIVGHIQTGSYDDKDGKKVYTTDIIVDAFDFVNSKGNSSNSNDDYTFVPEDDGELPF